MNRLSNSFRKKLKPFWTKKKTKNIVKLNLFKRVYLFFDAQQYKKTWSESFESLFTCVTKGTVRKTCYWIFNTG